MNYTVIVAEDEELLLNNLVHKIEKADPDFQVIATAQTGAQALSLVEQMSPDVVFTDIKMPVMDGIELLKQVKKESPETVVILLTAFEEFDLAREALRHGCDDYLSFRGRKPVFIKSHRIHRGSEIITLGCSSGKLKFSAVKTNRVGTMEAVQVIINFFPIIIKGSSRNVKRCRK